jgi:hypothetical protein
LPSQVIPAVIGPDQILRSGVDGLGYLADLAATMGVTPAPHAHAGTEPTSGRLSTTSGTSGLKITWQEHASPSFDPSVTPPTGRSLVPARW